MSPPSPAILDLSLLTAANRAVVYGAVARWLLHDLRGPAQALSLVLDLLQEGDATIDATLQQTLEDASGRLRGLLDLLDRTLRVPPADTKPGPIVLHEITNHLAELQRSSRSAVTLETESVRAAQLPAVGGVEEHLTHALLNLVVNANEALCDRRNGRVRMTAGIAPDGRTVSLLVEDDGPGVPPELMARLFQPYVTTKQGMSLAGLGLAVARHLLESSGGRIDYAPEAAGAPGARFMIELKVWSR